MLVKFILDPDAMFPRKGDEIRSRSTFKRFLKTWAKNGVLVLLGESNDLQSNQVFRNISSLPDWFRNKWQEIFIEMKRRDRGCRYRFECLQVNWKGFPSMKRYDDLIEIKDFSDLICLDDIKGEIELEMEETSTYVESLETEVCWYSCFDESESLQQMQVLSSTAISPNMKTIDVWNKYFKSLSSYSDIVKIVDRYALQNHFVCDGQAILLNENGEGEIKEGSGLQNLLKNLDRDGKNIKVKIYCSGVVKNSAPFVKIYLEKLRMELNRGGIESVTVYTLEDDSKFGKLFHGRIICFDKSMCEVDLGLEVLAGSKVYRRSSFSLKSMDQDVEKGMRSIESQASRLSIQF